MIDFEAAMKETGRPAGEFPEPGVEGAEATPAAQLEETERKLVLLRPPLAAVKPDFKKYEAEVGKWETEIGALVVKDPQTKEAAITIGGAAQKLKAALKKKRDEIWNPFLEFRKELDGFLDGFTSRLEKITAKSKEIQKPYDSALEMERLRAEKAAQEATRKVQEQVNQEAAALGVPPVKVEQPIIPQTSKKVKTSSGITGYEYKEWRGEVKDESKLDRKFLAPNQKKIDDAVKEGLREGMPGSEGLHIFEFKETRYR